MTRFVRIFILYILGLTHAFSAQNILHELLIKVYAPSLNDTSNIFICGNEDQLGNWWPDSIQLEFKGCHWEKNFRFQHGKKIEFKFTLGSWKREALTDDKNIPNNYKLEITKDTLLTYIINSWKDPEAESYSNGKITGTIEYHKQLEHEGLLPRDIVVWLPPEYKDNPYDRYPVLYMNDGQNLFDPATSFINAEWQMDEIADSLIRSRLIEPFIIVGIYNTKRRDLEYSDTGKGELYSHFILQTLKPFIDSTYRTLPGREYTSIGGSSLGGLASFLIAWNFSDHFSNVACFSPAFKYKEFDHTLNVTQYEGPKKDLDFFIYNGGLGVDSILQEGVDLMIDALLEQGYRKNENLFVKRDSSADHSEKAWAKYTPDFLKVFYTKMAGTDSSYSNDNSKEGKNQLQH